MHGKIRILCFLILLLFLLSVPLYAAEITGPDVAVRDGNIIVSTGLRLDESQLSNIGKGISKEIIFYIDLFRVWNYWPDEFILGKTFTNTLRCDPVKKEYTATSMTGTTLTEKRFTDCDPLLRWALSIPEMRLTNITELAPATYFVKVTVESRLRRLPPIISSLFFFVKETEFNISRQSRPFPLEPEQ